VKNAAINEELLAAAKRGDPATVQALLDQGADVHTVDEEGNTVLTHAAFNKDHVVADVSPHGGSHVPADHRIPSDC